MSMNMSGARGYTRISSNPNYRPYEKPKSPTAERRDKISKREASKSGRVKCQDGYVKVMGKCVPQEQRNKDNFRKESTSNKLINDSNKRFYKS